MAYREYTDQQAVNLILDSTTTNNRLYTKQQALNLLAGETTELRKYTPEEALAIIIYGDITKKFEGEQRLLRDFLESTSDFKKYTIQQWYNLLLEQDGFLPYQEGSLGFWFYDDETGVYTDKSEFESDLETLYPCLESDGTKTLTLPTGTYTLTSIEKDDGIADPTIASNVITFGGVGKYWNLVVDNGAKEISFSLGGHAIGFDADGVAYEGVPSDNDCFDGLVNSTPNERYNEYIKCVSDDTLAYPTEIAGVMKTNSGASSPSLDTGISAKDIELVEYSNIKLLSATTSRSEGISNISINTKALYWGVNNIGQYQCRAGAVTQLANGGTVDTNWHKIDYAIGINATLSVDDISVLNITALDKDDFPEENYHLFQNPGNTVLDMQWKGSIKIYTTGGVLARDYRPYSSTQVYEAISGEYVDLTTGSFTPLVDGTSFTYTKYDGSTITEGRGVVASNKISIPLTSGDMVTNIKIWDVQIDTWLAYDWIAASNIANFINDYVPEQWSNVLDLPASLPATFTKTYSGNDIYGATIVSYSDLTIPPNYAYINADPDGTTPDHKSRFDRVNLWNNTDNLLYHDYVATGEAYWYSVRQLRSWHSEGRWSLESETGRFLWYSQDLTKIVMYARVGDGYIKTNGTSNYVKLDSNVLFRVGDILTLNINLSRIIATDYFISSENVGHGIRYNGSTFLVYVGVSGFVTVPYVASTDDFVKLDIERKTSQLYDVSINDTYIGTCDTNSSTDININGFFARDLSTTPGFFADCDCKDITLGDYSWTFNKGYSLTIEGSNQSGIPIDGDIMGTLLQSDVWRYVYDSTIADKISSWTKEAVDTTDYDLYLDLNKSAVFNATTVAELGDGIAEIHNITRDNEATEATNRPVYKEDETGRYAEFTALTELQLPETYDTSVTINGNARTLTAGNKITYTDLASDDYKLRTITANLP